MFAVPWLLVAGALLNPQEAADQVQTFTLDNQMKVLVLEDHSIPNAVTYFFWRVGSRNEVPGITGLSHFFEHMMFNGAKKYGPKEFDRVMEAAGGANNAFTTKDVTVYTDFFPSSALETIFDLEADRIANLAFDDEMIESERGVVHSEYTTGMENSNFRFLDTYLTAVAIVAHPYHWPVIGWESDILSWTKEDLIAYFHTYYAPNNGVLVVVGDVAFDEVKRLAEEKLGPIPAHDPPRPVRTKEPKQNGERRLVLYKQVATPNVMMAYHVPETGSEDYYPLVLLDSILSEGNSSRLYRKLVDEERKATMVFTYLPDAFDPTLFYFYGVCTKGTSPQEMEQAMLSVVDDIVTHGVTERELQKAKNMRLVELYRNLETLRNKANELGRYELFFGDYRKLFEAPRAFEQVTTADIQRVAAKYLTETNRTVGYLVPPAKEGE